MLGLLIWLLAKGGGTVCDGKGKLDDSCSGTGDCNMGLICVPTPGSTGVCKVANGGVCNANDQCEPGSTCQDGICTPGGGLDQPCPCGEGFKCVKGVCKVEKGGSCNSDCDCADGECSDNVCVTFVSSDCNSGYTDSKSDLQSDSKSGYTDTRTDCKTDSRYDSSSDDSSCDSYDKYSTKSRGKKSYYTLDSLSDSDRKRKYYGHN